MPVDDRSPVQPPPDPPPEPPRPAGEDPWRAGTAATASGDLIAAAVARLAAAPETDAAAQAEAIRAAIAALRDAARNQDAFLHAAAHDLRNPLAAIRGHVQLLQRRARRFDLPPAEAERLGDGLAAIDAAVGRTATLIERLLDASWRFDDPDASLPRE